MCPHGPLPLVVCCVYGMLMAWGWLSPGPPYLWKHLVMRQTPMTKVFVFWATGGTRLIPPNVAHTLSPLTPGIHICSDSSLHMNSSLLVHSSSGQPHPVAFPALPVCKSL